MKHFKTTLAATAAALMMSAAPALAGGPTEITERSFNYDADFDGRVTRMEYRRVVDARRDFETADRDYDGRLARVEFDDDRFDDFDLDDDDYLDRDEYSDGMFNSVDRDRSGDLDEMEVGDLDED